MAAGMKIKNILFNEKYFFLKKINTYQLDRKIFDWFIYYAPYLDTKFSIDMNKKNVKRILEEIKRIFQIDLSNFFVNYTVNNIEKIEQNLELDNDMIFRFANRFNVNGRIKDIEKLLKCIFKHIRNCIAHGNVFTYKLKNEIYILFCDIDIHAKENIKSKFKKVNNICISAIFLLKYQDLKDIYKKINNVNKF